MLGRDAVARRVIARDELPQLAEPRGDDVERGAGDVVGDLLLEARDRHAGLPHHLAAVGGERAVEHLHQRALARAVAAEEAEALAALDGEARAIEQWRTAEGDRD